MLVLEIIGSNWQLMKIKKLKLLMVDLCIMIVKLLKNVFIYLIKKCGKN